MTGDRDRDEQLTTFLVERAGRLPDEVLDAVDVAVRTTPQVRAVATELPMQRRRLDPRPLLAAAAVVVVAVGLTLGGYLPDLGRLVGLGTGSSRPSGVPTVSVPSTPPPEATPQPSSPTEVDPFNGSWSTLDPDGSQMTLVFEGAGQTRLTRIADLRSTTCGGDAYFWQGTGTIDGGSIEVVGAGGCAGKPQDEPFAETYDYDAASGTIRGDTEFQGPITLVWSRGPLPLEAFRGRWVATDIDGTSLELVLEVADGLEREVVYHDTHAQFCTGLPGYTARGTGTVGAVLGDGRFLRVTLTGACDDGSSPREWEHKYEFEWATGTLIGPLAPLEIGGTRGIETVVWTRP